MNLAGEGIHRVDSQAPGPRVVISFGVHGNERSPIDAGERLLAELQSGSLALARGSVTLLLANPKASGENQRWSEGGVDLNRCFHASVLGREPRLYEEQRAQEIVAALRDDAEVLVDFHCTVEPGKRFLMHHPAVDDAAHRDVTRWLAADILLADPTLQFGNVSFDEWMSTRDRVGVCYETGWMNDPANTADAVLGEMKNLLAGLGLVAGSATDYGDKTYLELDQVLTCEADGFRWRDGVGENLQALVAGTVLGHYASGAAVTLDRDVTLVFPKKRPELLQVGKPLVYLAGQRS